MNNFKTLFYWLMTAFILIACQETKTNIQLKEDPLGHVKDEKAKAIIRASIEHAGGLLEWNEINHLYFTKQSENYSPKGAILKASEGIHNYSFNDNVYNIKSKVDGVLVNTSLENNKYSRKAATNKEVIEQSELIKYIHSEIFDITHPFVFLDPGFIFNYKTKQAYLHDSVEVLTVTYEGDKYEHVSKDKPILIYFDPGTKQVVAILVKSAQPYILIENVKSVRIENILFNIHRRHFYLDQKGNVEYMFVEDYYRNFKLR